MGLENGGFAIAIRGVPQAGGLISGAQTKETSFDWDPSQRSVIEADASDRMLVDAGPGTGKTAVACARLGHLIESGAVLPSQVWMISFTRTAIAEIRARLHGYVGDAAFAVKVATVDAHAWTIHSGYDPKATLTGSYDDNLDRVIGLIRDDDDVAEYLRNVEHLVVDEAQDLVGLHAELVETLVGALSDECGVTVFADEAQAIYGFSEEAGPQSDGREDLLDRLRHDAAAGFRSVSLETIHRTSAPGLRSIFSDVRAAVLRGGGTGLFTRIREAVSSHADSDDLKRTELGLDRLPAGTLVLFRPRSEALEASQFCTAPHSLRLSGYGANLPPWLAACFHDHSDRLLGQDGFAARWRERVVADCAPEYGADEAWSRLVRLGGTAGGAVDMHQLRRALSRRAAPVELANAEFGLPGPVLGTIHASKGREADSVLLLMPAGEEFASEEAEEEETRVLFVGSTRARASLRVGDASKWTGSSVASGRCYRILSKKVRPAAMVEFGRPEDLDAEGLVGTSHQGAASAAHAQRWPSRASQGTWSLHLAAPLKVTRRDSSVRHGAGSRYQNLSALEFEVNLSPAISCMCRSGWLRRSRKPLACCVRCSDFRMTVAGDRAALDAGAGQIESGHVKDHGSAGRATEAHADVLGFSPGGRTTRLHALADALGRSLRLVSSPADISGVKGAQLLKSGAVHLSPVAVEALFCRSRDFRRLATRHDRLGGPSR